ncbi:hypothetical protein MSG28_011986 [Choristoneura fumiferana]|uniref:Uncharacterized protein n=1 Tax=Choristoneura fumiferana TaxID=7141 RepID=A0ACC0KMJ6_CHOFU|nr:hypothetical protein MSG28_011986 [Choristoneura fumiferana]
MEIVFGFVVPGAPSLRSDLPNITGSTSREEDVERNDGVEEGEQWTDCEAMDSEGTERSMEVTEVAQPVLPVADTCASESIANAVTPWPQRLRPRDRIGNSRPKLKGERTESPISTSDSIKIENVENATKYAPQFKFPEKLYNLEMKTAGSSIRLKCAAKGNPLPNITWYKNKEHVILRPYLKPTYGKWFVELEELSMTDNGNYTCKVCNELGCIQHTTNLHVQERFPAKPYIKDGYPGNKTVFENDTVEFLCPAVSDLEPYVGWTWSLSNDTEKQMVQSDNKNDKPDDLTLYNVTSANQGWYECIALSILGNDTARGYLTVKKEGAIVVVINTLNKLKRENIKKKQAIDATVALMAEQWAKVVKIENNSQDDNSILPTVSIEKVRYTELKNEVNASCLPSEYILPVDTKWELPRENLIMGSVLVKVNLEKLLKLNILGQLTQESRVP